MTNWSFRRSQLIGNVLTLEFDRTAAHSTNSPRPMSVTIPIENANDLAAGVINALRAAEQRGSQIPPIRLNATQEVLINALPVDEWRVTKSPQFPGRALLHLLAGGGLYLTYSFGTDVTRFVGEALAAAAQEPSSLQTPETRQ